MADSTALTEMSRAFFQATAAGDEERIRALCAPRFEGVQNGGRPFGLDALVQLSVAVKRAIPDFRYESALRAATADGFVEEHAVRGTLPDGSTFDIPICVVAAVEDGRIVRMREYFDSRQGDGLIRALSA